MAIATTVEGDYRGPTQRAVSWPEADHDDLHRVNRNGVVASCYGTAAGLVFGKLYFPDSDALSGTLLAFGTYFMRFVGRPIGAAIFGFAGDRIGRKATLIATLLCMGLATFAIAFVPTYSSISILGAVC